MSTNLTTPAQWAQAEFGFAQLGDQRRNQRLVNIAEHLAASPGGTLPQAFPHWAELKAAYRFFGQRGVTFERILTPHLERTRQACRQPGEYLLIEDTTLLDYSRHAATENLGVIGDGGRAGVLNCTARWRCGWKRGRWHNGLKARWWACLSNPAARPGPRPSGRRAGSG